MADVLDLLTVDEARQILDIGAYDDTELANLERAITAVSRRLERGVGPVIIRTITDEKMHGGLTSVWLKKYPVHSITTVTETLYTVPTILTTADYYANPYDFGEGLLSGELARVTGIYRIWWAPGWLNIKVTYEAGRFADTDSVDPLYKEAAGYMLRNAWRSNEISVGGDGNYDVPTQHFPRFGVPQVVKDLLAEEWQDLPGVA